MALARQSQVRSTSPLRPAISPPSRPVALIKPDPEASLQEQANKLSELWYKFLNSSSFGQSRSTSVLDNIIKNLGIITSILRAQSGMHPQHHKSFQLLLAESLQLASLAELHMLNYGSAMKAAQEAERYARQWQDFDLAVASIMRQSQISYYQSCAQVRYAQYQRAVKLFGYLQSPLLQSLFIMGMAEVQASVGLEHEHRRTYQIALGICVKEPENDPAYSYLQDYRLSISAARYNIAADDLFAAQNDLADDRDLIARSDFFAADAKSLLAEIYIGLQDCNNAIKSVTSLAQKSLALGSLLRYNQAQSLHEVLLASPFVQGKEQELARLGNIVCH